MLDVRALRQGTAADQLDREFAGIPLHAAQDRDLPGATPQERDFVRRKCRCWFQVFSSFSLVFLAAKREGGRERMNREVERGG